MALKRSLDLENQIYEPNEKRLESYLHWRREHDEYMRGRLRAAVSTHGPNILRKKKRNEQPLERPVEIARREVEEIVQQAVRELPNVRGGPIGKALYVARRKAEMKYSIQRIMSLLQEPEFSVPMLQAIYAQGVNRMLARQ